MHFGIGNGKYKMNSKTILFISNHLPRDFVRDVQGGYQRMRMFVDAIVRLGLNIHFVFFMLPRENLEAAVVRKNIKESWGIDATVSFCPMSTLQDPRPMSFWRYYVAPALTLRNNPEYGPMCGPEQLRILSSNLEAQPTAIFAFGLGPMLPLTLLGRHFPPTYFDLNDIEHKKALRTLGTLRARMGTWLRYLQVPAIVRAERAAIALAAKTFVCSDIDKGYLEKKFGASNIRTIPNAVDFAVTPRSASDAKIVLFLGSIAYPPNSAAVELLVTTIWPLVIHHVSDARLLIVGPGAEALPCRQASPAGVEFVGFVPDVEPYYGRARVICCPIMIGGGTRIKLIEAAAYGKAIVSTTIGAEGLDFRDGVHALIRDTPKLIAKACVDLLLDAVRATKLGTAAREFARGKYSRESAVEKICQELSS